MGCIRQLDEQLINQIAAGEVIERPASVVKELLENALDASSTDIVIRLADGGLHSIDIQDNGVGMSKDDLLLAPQRHTTSKLTQSSDLFSIASLGFRGEALASIASVSHMRVATRQKDDVGYAIEDGELTEVGCPQGTRVTVVDLFYNTPARKKYMKQPQTELRRCLEVVRAYAMLHPSIGFVVHHNGLEVLNVSATSHFDRLVDLLGKDVGRHLVPLEQRDAIDAVRVEGFIGKPEIARKTKDMQFFFVNGRYISSTTISAALGRAYEGSLHHGMSPVAVIQLDVHPRKIDVNVHPTKAQIRFEDEQQLFRGIYYATKQTLEAQELIRNIDVQKVTQSSFSSDASTLTTQSFTPVVKEEVAKYPVQESQQSMLQDVSPQTEASLHIPAFRVLGLVNKKFIVAEVDDGCVLVDFHAAHERINYERLRRKFKDQAVQSQVLVSPEVIDINPIQFSAFVEHKELLSQLGYVVEEFGEGSIVVRSIPIVINKQMHAKVIVELLDELGTQKKHSLEQKEEDIIARMACRMSYMAGDELTLAQMTQIIKDLHDLDIAYSCPHGRPIMLRLSNKELDKLFERTM